MKITLTAYEVKEIIRAHVQANAPGVEIGPGEVELDYGRNQYDSPEFAGYSFTFEKKVIKTKYDEAKAIILKMPRDNKIRAIKEMRDAMGTLTPLEVGSFPNVSDVYGHPQAPTPTLGLAYSKALVENVWVQNPDLDF